MIIYVIILINAICSFIKLHRDEDYIFIMMYNINKLKKKLKI
jgi:hypothetical protein